MTIASDQLNELFRRLSACEISRTEFEEATGREWWWGDILAGLGERGLPYPNAKRDYLTDAQRKLAEEIGL